ncbi:hypothetical protein [Chryseobacterium sp.]|uniref:hypothetical protein n=1 Tax=Chryseobacterium sp. TaxID=1871047 RepID=UPI00289EAE6C|nr:hypothetical protein [Chryseobacterium sp.]
MIEYIRYDDFVLPEIWLDRIKSNNFSNKILNLDYEKIISGQVDIFENFKRSFYEPSSVNEALK